MGCPKCGGIMLYNKQKDMLVCLSCFYQRMPNDRIKKVRDSLARFWNNPEDEIWNEHK